MLSQIKQLSPSVRLSEPVFGTVGLLFCMKNVAKPIIEVRLLWVYIYS